MHPLQQAFVEAFKAWDSDAMARALIELSEEFAQRPLSDAAKDEVTWRCREFLAEFELYPLLESSVHVAEIKTTFLLETTPQPVSQDDNAQYDSIKFSFDVYSAGEPGIDYWRQIGVQETQLLLARAEVHTPGPLRGEPGHKPYINNRVSLHRPAQITLLSPRYTYAHALSVEASKESPYLRRYLAGECRQVWQELTDMGERVRDPDILPHAVAVARETMRRSRRNVEHLHQRLQARRYRFEDRLTVVEPPVPDVLEQIARLEACVGPLPLSLCAWYEIVGAVNFMHTSLDDFDALLEIGEEEEEDGYCECSDPLVVYPAAEALAYSEENWERERYRVIIAPDYYHKDSISGGPAYSVFLPDAGADTLFVYEPRETTFVNYLRLAFQQGGFTFPELESNSDWRVLCKAEAKALLPV